MKEKIYVEIVGDTNDADFITERTEIKTKKDMKLIEKLVAALKGCKTEDGENWPTSEYCDTTVEELYDGVLTEDDIEDISVFVPFGERGIHTIDYVTILHVSKQESLYHS